jgi:hypothetical protein
LSALQPTSRLDDDVLAYARSPAVVGAKTIHLGDRCVERALARERAPRPGEHMRLLLRQRIECGRYRRSPPAALPAELRGRWHGFVDCGDLLFCLVRRAEARAFDAVTCFDPACTGWTVCCGSQHERFTRSDVIVDVSPHAVRRYVERVRSSADLGRARAEVERLLADESRVLPELPQWLTGQAREDAPYYLVFDRWLVVPLAFSFGSSVRFTALTCLGRGLGERANAAARVPRRAERARRLASDALVVQGSGHRRMRRKRRAAARRPPSGASGWDEAGQ